MKGNSVRLGTRLWYLVIIIGTLGGCWLAMRTMSMGHPPSGLRSGTASAKTPPIVWSLYVTRNDGGDGNADIVERAIGTGERATTDQVNIDIAAPPDCVRTWAWKNGLDPRVWASTVSSSGEREEPYVPSREQKAPHVYNLAFPTGCRATGVYVDASQVFLVPRPGAELEAARDLFDCCLALEAGDDPYPSWVRDTGRCTRSVSPAVCSCFPVLHKYAPAVWIGQDGPVEEGETRHRHAKGSLPLRTKGVAWIMHHYAAHHHPDHFNMKMLEYHGLYTTRCAAPSNAWVPRDITALVSLDYPLNRSTFTDYEQTVMGIIERGIGNRKEQRPMLMTMSATEFSGSCYSSGEFATDQARVEAIRGMCRGVATLLRAERGTGRDDTPLTHPYSPARSQMMMLGRHMGCQLGEMTSPHCSTSTRVLHLDEAFWSPNYNKNIPLPHELSRATLRRSIQRALDPTWLATHCGGHSLRKQPRVSIMRRVEGEKHAGRMNLRRWLNEAEVRRTVTEETGVHAVRTITPNSKTSALEQFGMFCGFDILLTPHSSQLANLWFANPGSSVIEVQGRRAVYEKSFIMLSESVNLHHQVLRGNADNGNDGGWSSWDHVVDILHLRAALRRAMQNLRKQGIIGP
jgi:hypothetical protein